MTNEFTNSAPVRYEAGKVTGVICHATFGSRPRTSDGKLLVEEKTWTGFANSEEDFADQFVGMRLQPFRIEDEARKIAYNFHRSQSLQGPCCA